MEAKPWKQVLIAFRLGRVRIEPRADDLVCLVVDTEHQVAARPAAEACRIRKRGQVLPDLLRFMVAAFELQPLRLRRTFPQPVDQRYVPAAVHIGMGCLVL